MNGKKAYMKDCISNIWIWKEKSKRDWQVFCFSFESSLFDINHPFCFRGFTYYSYRWRRLFFWVSDIVVSYSLPLPLSLFLFFGSSIFCDISEWSFSWICIVWCNVCFLSADDCTKKRFLTSWYSLLAR